MSLPSTKPYLLRAIWEWCCDNAFTPYVSVQVDGRTMVPREFVRDGQIVLNIGPGATNRLKIGNELIEFQARFGRVARELSVPVAQVLAIYARENGAGMAFELEEDRAFDEATAVVEDPSLTGKPSDDDDPPRPEGGRPKLQRIK